VAERSRVGAEELGDAGAAEDRRLHAVEKSDIAASDFS
jgi:hypothetical protein